MLQDLHARYGERVAFVTLYVREAHPGERISQPETFAGKLAHARAYQRRDGIPWPVAVDDLDGTVHHALGRLPDLAYVIDRHGLVAGRVLWSNDARGLEQLVRAVVDDRRPARPTRYAAIAPLVRGLGTVSPILGAAGRSARRDMLLTLPPLYLAARAASLFRPLSPAARGVAGLAVVVVTMLAVGAALRSRRSA